MKKILFVLLALYSYNAHCQLDTIVLATRFFGIPSIEGKADFMAEEAYKANQAMRSIDSLNNVIDVTDSTGAFTIIVTDSISAGAMYYSDTYWDDLRVPLTNTKINPALSEPDFEDMGNGVFAWGFDANNDSANILHFVAQLPHGYKEATDLLAHLHWAPEDTNTGDVRWKLTYYIADINAAITGPFYLWAIDAGDGTSYKHQLIGLGTITGSSLGISGMIFGNVTRTGDIGSDDYTGSAYGLELDFHFEIDSPGTRLEYTK